MKPSLKRVLVYLVFAIAFFCIFLLLSKVFNLGYPFPKLLILSILVSAAVFLKTNYSGESLRSRIEFKIQ
jgi:hypothetical protein